MNPNQKAKMKPLAVVLLLSAGFFVLFLVISGILFFNGPKPSAAKVSDSIFSGGGGIGVIDLSGVIMDSKRILKQLEQFEESSSVRGIVIRLNSPGGSVAPSQEIYEAVKRIDRTKKPVYSSMQSVAASGAYYVATGTRKIFANPGTITGSIGVIMEFMNLEKLYEWAKVKRFSIKTGKFKDSGTDTREMTEEERGLIQGMIDDVLGQFKAAVMEGRKMTAAEVDPVADGRIFSGQQAKAVKLVDSLGTFRDAVDDMASMLKIKGKPKLIFPEQPHTSLKDFLLQETKDSDEESRSLVSNWSQTLAQKFLGVSASDQRPMLEPGIYWLWTSVR